MRIYNIMPINKDIAIEIKEIFDNNTLSDLKRFLNKRQCLNTTNTFLVYLFHLVQSAGILTTSIGAGNQDTMLVWLGVALNILATLINVIEKTNSSILKKLMNDIKAIKIGNYVDEGEIIDVDEKSDKKKIETETDSISQPLLSENPSTSTYKTFTNTENTVN